MGVERPSSEDLLVEGFHSRSGTHQLVDLGEGWVLDVQAVCGYQVQGCVVQYHLAGHELVTSFVVKGDIEVRYIQLSFCKLPSLGSDDTLMA